MKSTNIYPFFSSSFETAVQKIDQTFAPRVRTLDKVTHLIERIWDRCVAIFSSERAALIRARSLLTHPTADLTQSLQFFSDIREIFNRSSQNETDLLGMSSERFKGMIQSLGESERKELDAACYQYSIARFHPSFNDQDSSVVALFQMAQKSGILFQQALKTVEADLLKKGEKAPVGDARSFAFIIWVTNNLKRFGVKDSGWFTASHWIQNGSSFFVETLALEFVEVTHQIANGKNAEKDLEVLHLKIKNSSEKIGQVLNEDPNKIHQGILRKLNTHTLFKEAALKAQEMLLGKVKDYQYFPSVMQDIILKLESLPNPRTREHGYKVLDRDKNNNQKALYHLSLIHQLIGEADLGLRIHHFMT